MINNDSTFNIEDFSSVNLVDPNSALYLDPDTNLVNFNSGNQNVEEA